MEIPRMSYRHRTRRDDSGLRERLLKLAREKPRFGYRGLWVMLTSDERVNHKRVWRVYRDLGLSVKRTRRKRLERALRPRPVLTAPNQELTCPPDPSNIVTEAEMIRDCRFAFILGPLHAAGSGSRPERARPRRRSRQGSLEAEPDV